MTPVKPDVDPKSSSEQGISDASPTLTEGTQDIVRAVFISFY